MNETYVPDKPCRKGHSLRYSKSRACVECCKIKGRDPRRAEYYRKQRVEDPERFREYQRKWLKSHPEKRLWDAAQYRASLSGTPFEIEPEDVVIPEVCPVFGTPIEKPTLDRIHNDKGYVKGNVAVISHKANRLKADATIADLQAIIRYMSLTK